MEFKYFIYNFKTHTFEIISIDENYKKDYYFHNSMFGTMTGNKIIQSSQLDTALFYKKRNYLRNFIRADFYQLFSILDCFDWIQEQKNIIRRLLK